MKTFIIAAISVDGFIGRDDRHASLEWTSPEDKKQFVTATKAAGVMVMGSSTYATINRGLPGRKTIVYTSHPEKLAGVENVEATNEAPADLIARLETEGYNQVAICGGSTVYSQFLQAGVVDELRLVVEPLVFGGGVPLFNQKFDANLELVESKQLNANTLQLIYSVIR